MLAVCTSLTEGLLIKQYNKKHEKGGFVFTAIISLFSMLFFLVFDLITDKKGLTFSVEMLPYAIAAGIVYCVASVLTFFALKYGSYALTMLILSYSLIFTTIYGLIFLNERVKVFTYIGFVLIALSLFFVRVQKTEEDQQKKNLFLWLLFVFISVACAGMFGVIQRMQQIRFEDAVTREFMVIALGSATVISFGIGLYSDKKDCLQILKQGLPYAATAGVANGATNMLSMFVYTLMPISIVSPTSAGVKIVISFILSCLVFKEKFLKRQVLGVVLGGIAVVLLNI